MERAQLARPQRKSLSIEPSTFASDCIVPIYKAKLKAREKIAAETMAFHFEKPRGFSYKAGQFADYTLINQAEPA
jgi:predicted ferric reductase